MKQRINPIPPIKGARPQDELLREQINRIVGEVNRALERLEARVRELENKNK